MTAGDLLKRMAEAYAAARTYVDTGEVGSKMTFSTAFERPAWFHFAFADGGRPHRILCRNEGMASLLRGKERTGVMSIEMAIATLTGTSSLSAHTVPRLLMPDRVRGWSIAQLAKPVLEGEEEGCHRLTGRTPSGRETTLWIDAERHLLRKMLLRTSKGDAEKEAEAIDARLHAIGIPASLRPVPRKVRFEAETVTAYRPVLNGPADRAAFRRG